MGIRSLLLRYRSRVYLAGRVMIESPDLLIERADFPGRHGQLTFVYLASSPRRAERDQLGNVLWRRLA